MAAGDALRELAERVRRVERAGQDVAEAAAPGVLEAVRETARAGMTPEGEAWAPTQDGKRPLEHAAEAISVSVGGDTEAVILLEVKGHHYFHHFGVGAGRQRQPGKKLRKSKSTGRNIPARPILPTGDATPKPIRDAIARAAGPVVARVVRGGS